MSESIIIPLDNPVVVPARDEKTFDSLWITQLLIRTLPPTDLTGGGLVEIEYAPMSSQTFEILDQIQSISTDQLMRATQEVPEVAQAMGAVLLAIDPLKQWLLSLETPEIPPE
jgi:hypothetical protein